MLQWAFFPSFDRKDGSLNKEHDSGWKLERENNSRTPNKDPAEVEAENSCRPLWSGKEEMVRKEDRELKISFPFWFLGIFIL